MGAETDTRSTPRNGGPLEDFKYHNRPQVPCLQKCRAFGSFQPSPRSPPATDQPGPPTGSELTCLKDPPEALLPFTWPLLLIPPAVSLGGPELAAGADTKFLLMRKELNLYKPILAPEGGWWAYFQKSHILHILCGFRTFLSKWMTAVCVCEHNELQKGKNSG